MSEDLARQKRVQAALSLGGASLGLAALGTKGVATGTRSALKRAPQAAKRLRLTPKVADKADKASLGLVTTASGVGGASGIHFARLQQAEAKKEDKVAKRDINGKDQPRKVKFLPKASGLDPEKRRQQRMKAEQYGLAAGSGVAGGAAAAYGADAVYNARTSRAATRRAASLKRKSSNKVNAAMSMNQAGMKTDAARASRGALDYTKAARRSEGVARTFKLASKARGKQAGKAAAVAGALGAASYGVKRMRNKQGRAYTDWWDG